MTPLRVSVPGDGYHQNLISCQVACPVHTDARGYVRAIAAGEFQVAYRIAREPNPFASICGRVCGAPCETACRRGQVPRVDDDGRFVARDKPIAIRALKRFVCDLHEGEARPAPGAPEAAGKRVAIIGSGPAGLSAAHDLALMGARATVFEAEPVAAGMLALGVPAYRLPREVIAREVGEIRSLGVEIRCGVAVGKDISFAGLRRDFDAVIIAVGAKSSRGLNLAGERGPRVYGGVDLLRAVALGERMDIGREVVVIGGGNVAYDVARSVLRQIAYDTARTAARLAGTAKVRLVSLEGLEEMPADTLEIVEGDEEGVERMNGWGPVEIRRDEAGRPAGVEFRRCERVYDENRRFAPVFRDTERTVVACDTVLLAVGQSPALEFLEDGGGDIEMLRPGWPRVDRETLATTAPGVFVAGDLAHGTRLLIDAVASGRQAARSVFEHLTGRRLQLDQPPAFQLLEGYRRERGYESIRRQAIPVAEPAERLAHPEALVEIGYSRELAMKEASRCLDCGVTPVFDGSRCVLCGGCVDVCPTLCLRLAPLDELEGGEELADAIRNLLGPDADLSANSAIMKDEERCIRCALCVMRCPVDAIGMERVTFNTTWRTA